MTKHQDEAKSRPIITEDLENPMEQHQDEGHEATSRRITRRGAVRGNRLLRFLGWLQQIIYHIDYIQISSRLQYHFHNMHDYINGLLELDLPTLSYI
ncbi:hypothetical protein BS78_04G259900 [Paspalum vaginatum]|nr:hypothetical protein BS78_04G259900 [Paspalum vaginatum]